MLGRRPAPRQEETRRKWTTKGHLTMDHMTKKTGLNLRSKRLMPDVNLGTGCYHVSDLTIELNLVDNYNCLA